MKYKTIKTFTFLDESGALNPIKDRQKYFGIGALKHTNPIRLVNNLHKAFEGLCAALKKDETRVEFSFKATTASSINYDLQFIDILEQDFEWEFNCLYFDTNSPDYQEPKNAEERWEKYVSCSKMLVKNNLWSNEETILLADYQRKPKGSRKKFEFVAIDIPQVYNVLQVESHGVLLIQAADLLLGGFLYSLNPESGDKERNKVRISERVLRLKEKVGKKKFNCWKVDWGKSSRWGG